MRTSFTLILLSSLCGLSKAENPDKVEELNSNLVMMLDEMDTELLIKNPEFKLNV